MTIPLVPQGPRDVFVTHERQIDDTQRALQYRRQTPSVTGASTNAFVTAATATGVAGSTDETYNFTLAGVLTTNQVSLDFVPVIKAHIYQIDCSLQTVDPSDNFFAVLLNNGTTFSAPFTIPAGAKTHTSTFDIRLANLGTDWLTIKCTSAGGTAAGLVATIRLN